MKPLRLLALALAVGLATVSAASAVTLLDWDDDVNRIWLDGDTQRTYQFGPPENVDMTIKVSTTTSGTPTPGTFTSWNGFPPESFPCTGVTSPNKDGSGRSTNRFGTKTDLAIVFDPAASNNQSVLIDIWFTDPVPPPGVPGTGPRKAVSTLKFEISDIDWSRGGSDCLFGGLEGWRLDQVEITAQNNGTVVPLPPVGFTLSHVAGTTPTYTIGTGETANIATATGTVMSGLESNSDNNGTMTVDFGATAVTDVKIRYNEAAYNLMNNNDPGYRGIGLFGVTTFPVELMEFTIE